MSNTVLIVEDFDDARQFMRFFVESLGYQVVEATNGLEAIESVKKASPDLILMDIGLPVMDGITATKQIRRLNEGKSMPIIAVTAHGDWFEEKALEAGCNKVIDKPVEQGFLKQLIFDFLPV